MTADFLAKQSNKDAADINRDGKRMWGAGAWQQGAGSDSPALDVTSLP